MLAKVAFVAWLDMTVSILMQKYSCCYGNWAKTSENIMAINKLIKKSNQFMIDVKRKFKKWKEKVHFCVPFFPLLSHFVVFILNSVDIFIFSWPLDFTQWRCGTCSNLLRKIPQLFVWSSWTINFTLTSWIVKNCYIWLLQNARGKHVIYLVDIISYLLSLFLIKIRKNR